MKSYFDVCHIVIERALYEWTQDNEFKSLRKSRLMASYVEIDMYVDLQLYFCRNKHHLAVGTAAVAQWVRAFALYAEGLVFESYPRQT